jgi:hypothetical protein
MKNYREEGPNVFLPEKHVFHVNFSKKFAGQPYVEVVRYLQARYNYETILAILEYLEDKKIVNNEN